MSSPQRCPLFCIVPPYIFDKMIESEDYSIRKNALDTMVADARVRGIREVSLPTFGVGAAEGSRRTVYDARHSHFLGNAVLLRSEGDPPVQDESANRLYDGLGSTRDFFSEVFDRDSIDDRGHRLEGYVHVGNNYNNATFDGTVMRFGDGDGNQFTDFTKSLDVVAHELAHGVTQYTSNFEYAKQPGALNESMSDVFGSLVKQWVNNETVDEADWLIGTEVFTPGTAMDALRSMSAPGTAYNHPLFGRDPQPSHMDGYYNGSGDNYGVHINSGIPNKAFYETANIIGGYAWEIAGHVWYAALIASSSTSQFQEFADKTYLAASEYGPEIQAAAAEGWRSVGIRVAGLPAGVKSRRTARDTASATINADTLNELTKQVMELAEVVRLLKSDIEAKPSRTPPRKKTR